MTEQTTTAHINIEKVEQMAAYYEAPAGFFDWLDLMKDLNSTHNPQSREDDEREAFEAWYASGWKHNGFQRTHCGGGYLIAAIEQAWQGWKARADLVGPQPTAAACDVLAERMRQISAEGWTPEHDDAHQHSELARAASCYAMGADLLHNGQHLSPPPAPLWPWSHEWWKPSEPRRMLVKAGALILAEIERIDRQQAGSPEGLNQPQQGGDQ